MMLFLVWSHLGDASRRVRTRLTSFQDWRGLTDPRDLSPPLIRHQHHRLRHHLSSSVHFRHGLGGANPLWRLLPQLETCLTAFSFHCLRPNLIPPPNHPRRRMPYPLSSTAVLRSINSTFLLTRALRLSSAPLARVSTMPKRSRAAAAIPAAEENAPPLKRTPVTLPPASRLQRRSSVRNATKASTDPDVNDEVIDAPNALRASPDSAINGTIAPAGNGDKGPDSPLPDVPDVPTGPKKHGKVKKKTPSAAQPLATPKKGTSKAKGVGDEALMSDPEAEEEDLADDEEIKQAVSRPPPVHSDYLPLPWKGRLGYVCLVTCWLVSMMI